jgi:hypothetical protein
VEDEDDGYSMDYYEDENLSCSKNNFSCLYSVEYVDKKSLNSGSKKKKKKKSFNR